MQMYEGKKKFVHQLHAHIFSSLFTLNVELLSRRHTKITVIWRTLAENYNVAAFMLWNLYAKMGEALLTMTKKK